jgi:serine protease Do
MRKYFLSITGVAALVLLLSQSTVAQDKEEIIIKRKTNKDAKVTIEIKGENVTVNGKPVDDYEDDNVTIRKRKSDVMVYGSPFRSQNGAGAFNFNDGHGVTVTGSPTAFLGVVTERSSKGARIESVTKGSAAEKAGLKEDDVIIKIDESNTEDADDVSRAVRKHKPEEKATMTDLREGKENNVTVTRGKRKNEVIGFSSPDAYAPKFDFDWKGGGFGQTFAYGGRPRLGIKAQDTEDGKGVKVLSVDDESIAEKSGVKEGDVITEFNGKKVNSADELATAAQEVKDKNAFNINVTRNGSSQVIEVKIPKKLKTTNL